MRILLLLHHDVLRLDDFIKLLSVSNTEIQVICKHHQFTIIGKELKVKEYYLSEMVIQGVFEQVLIRYE
ncbi:MAG: YabP/YqfC family sporulation protein [Erysipelotrichaceae bacterium]|nr:YabP/YqfC family sporulation protein [Erysipelotrichaceae bacterium]